MTAARPHISTTLLIAAAIGLAAHPASAQSYPTQTVRITVSTGAGSLPIDRPHDRRRPVGQIRQGFHCREQARRHWHDRRRRNRERKPDGYSLLLADNALTAINKSMHAKLSYDPEKDFAPITELARQPFLVYSHVGLGAKSFKEFVALLKAKPGELNYGSAGVGSLQHLCAERLLQAVGAKALHVPYKSGNELSRGIIGNEVQFACSGTSGFQLVEAGKVNLLIVTSAEPTPLLPSAPTLKQETGIDGFEMVARIGLLAPAGTPRSIIEQLSNDVRDVMKEQRLKDILARQSTEVATEGPDAYAAVIRREIADFSKVVKEAGLSPQ